MIHLFENHGYFIALDVHSGAVHVLDKPVYDLLLLLDSSADSMPPHCPSNVLDALSGSYDRDELREIYDELLGLHQAGQLFSVDDYAPFADKMGPSPLKAMCLHVSHDCNLRCRYCFAGQGNYGGKCMVMSEKVAHAAIDFLLEHSAGRCNLEVDFFGGEPLLNLDVVKSTVAYARSLEQEHGKCFRFTMTTNGILLSDETADWLNAEMHNVVLSLDGRKDINDHMRPRVGGQGSYDSIVPKYQKLVKARAFTGKDYYIRGTFTRDNIDFAEDVMHMASLGFDQVSVEPVVGDPAEPYTIRDKELPRVFAEYDRLAEQLIEKRRGGDRLNFFHFMLDLDQGPCAIKRLRGCGCGNEYAAVEPGGDVYPCHQFVGKPEWRMGSVLDRSYDMEMKRMFSNATVYNKEPCRDCWAKFYCSGGCNANNDQYAGDILKAHELSCELEKKRLECAIMIRASAALSE